MDHPPRRPPPSEPAGHDLEAIQRLILDGARKLVVLDDDPTGTQTVHGLDVLTEWSVASLEEALNDARPGFFILTNSRALVESEAVALNAGIAANLRTASARTGTDFSIVSRSDSTLRGHFAAELKVLAATAVAPIDGIIVIPAFFEGGRYTIDNVHFVDDGRELVPVAETEFARDATFGFRHSDLRDWIEEKTGGVTRADQVMTVSLDTLRERGAEGVRSCLAGAFHERAVVVNAENYADMAAFVHGLLLAEADGKRFLFRTAASFVRIRAGIPAGVLLPVGELPEAGPNGGLVIVGSYVKKSSEQLEELLSLPGIRPIELVVDQLVDREAGDREILRVGSAVDQAISKGETAVVYTSRSEVTALGRAGSLDVAETVSRALVGVVRAISYRPSFIIAKGGITSSEIAVKGLGVRKARVLGQVAAGVPVWQLGGESTYPGIRYIIFPGNVGSKGTLRELVAGLSR